MGRSMEDIWGDCPIIVNMEMLWWYIGGIQTHLSWSTSFWVRRVDLSVRKRVISASIRSRAAIILDKVAFWTDISSQSASTLPTRAFAAVETGCRLVVHRASRVMILIVPHQRNKTELKHIKNYPNAIIGYTDPTIVTVARDVWVR